MEKNKIKIITKGRLSVLNIYVFSPVSKLPTSKSNILTSTQRGVATLPMVMVLGILALVVAVSATTLSFTELMISQGGGQSSRAQFYAESGARDALIRIVRNKAYLCATADCYTIDFSTGGCASGNDCAKVQVTGNDTAKTVISKGVMKSSIRTLQVAVTLDTDGQVTSAAWSEVTN